MYICFMEKSLDYILCRSFEQKDFYTLEVTDNLTGEVLVEDIVITNDIFCSDLLCVLYAIVYLANHNSSIPICSSNEEVVDLVNGKYDTTLKFNLDLPEDKLVVVQDLINQVRELGFTYTLLHLK